MDLDEGQRDGERELDQAPYALVQRAHLFQIDAYILRLQLKRESLIKQLDVCKYPVITLPNEITSEIFIHALDLPSLNTQSPAPTVLAQVCRHWRNIALSLPMLWSTISLKIARKTLENRLIMANTWLDRSGTHPLSITFNHGPDDHGVTSPGVKFAQFLLEISRHFFRLKHLEVGVTLIGPSLQLVQSRMPQLTHLALWMDRLHTPDAPVVISPETFPLLRSLELHHFHPFTSVIFPWKQITTLICDHIDYRHLRSILEQTPALLHCEVSHMRSAVGPSEKPITLPHLESLIFSLYPPDENPVHRLFPISAMTLPALRILQIPETYLHYPAFDVLLALVSRSECRLEKLRIIDLTYTSKQTYKDKFPSIPSLSFRRQFPGITA
ncbi:hypothetical protein DFH09DRAFT_1330770 [Mycena vulgaris]|nr:hypothetical protein DFH09DRAFT_1330770 [Mycena vulgaris]